MIISLTIFHYLTEMDQDRQEGLDMLKEFWRLNVLEVIRQEWIRRDKANYTYERCRQINDLLAEAYEMLQSFTVRPIEQYVLFLQTVERIRFLMQ